MIGFLSNLISRSSGRMPTIQPRLASLFEPQHGASPQLTVSPLIHRDETCSTAAGMAEENSRNSTVTYRVHGENRVPDAQLPIEDSLAIPMQREIAVRIEAPEFAYSHEPRQAVTKGLVGAENGHEFQPSAIFLSPGRFDPSSAPKSEPSIPVVLQRRKKPGQKSTDHHPADLGHQTGTFDDRASPFTSRSPGLDGQDFVAHPPEFAAPTAAAPRETIAPATQAHPAAMLSTGTTDAQLNLRSWRNLLEVTKPEPAPEPVVHVSIDRIEVRAIAPTAPSNRSQRSAQPGMSLKEYLRRRASGRNAREAAS
jgi:hypothetical protein